jgi:plastocyanin
MRIRGCVTFAIALVVLLAPQAHAADTAVGTAAPFSFTPNSITIDPGDSVTVTNTSGGFHTVVFDDTGTECGTPSTTWVCGPHTYSEPGTYTFHCGIHLSAMTATVHVNPIVYTWTGATGDDWATAGNWTTAPAAPGTAPGLHSPTDIVKIANGTRPKLDADVTVAELRVQAPGGGRQGTGTLTVTGGTTTGGADLAGSGTTVFAQPSLTIDGLTLHDTATATVSGTSTLAGTVALNDSSTLQNTGTFHGGGGSVTGAGGTLVNAGTLDPGGTSTLGGAFQQTAAGTLAIDLGPAGAERVNAASATLAGKLKVTTAGGYTPATTDTFPLVSAPLTTGRFTAFEHDSPGGRNYTLAYATTGVTLGVEAPPPAESPPPGAGASTTTAPTPTQTAPTPSQPTPTPTVKTSTVAMTKLAAVPAKCRPKRTLVFKLRRIQGAKAARILVNGKKAATRAGPKLASKIALRRLPTKFTLRIEVTLNDGSRVVATKKYARC